MGLSTEELESYIIHLEFQNKYQGCLKYLETIGYEEGFIEGHKNSLINLIHKMKENEVPIFFISDYLQIPIDSIEDYLLEEHKELKRLDYNNLCPKLQRSYIIATKKFTDAIGCIDYALENGVYTGRNEGRKYFITPIIRRMIKANNSNVYISEKTGLSMDELEKILEE